MFNKRILAVLMVIFSMCAIALADAAPEPGYVRVANPLILEAQDDFKGYRFFLDSPGGLEEIKLAKGKTTTISSEGRGGSMRFTTLIAISMGNLGFGYDGPMTPEKLEAVQKDIRDKKITGVIELTSHTFDAYVKKRAAKTYKSPKYLLKTSAAKKIEAVEVKITPSKKTKAELEEEEGSSHVASTIVSGSFMSLGLIFGGVWFARRKKRV